MERQANYTLVGVICMALLIVGFVAIVWLAHFQFNQTYDEYRTFLRGPVSGLGRGAPVQFNGIKVGEITRIALDPRNPNRIITDIKIDHGTPVRTDSSAQTASQGITGVKYLEIAPGSPAKPLLMDVSSQRPAIIAASSSETQEILANVDDISRGADEAIGRVNRLLSDQNIATISRSLNDVSAVAGELSAQRAMFARIGETAGKLDHAATDLQVTMASARKSLGGNAGALSEVAAASRQLNATIADARKLVTGTDGAVNELSTTTLPQINAAVVSLQHATEALEGLASDIREDPRSFISRPRGKEVEVPQ